MVAEVGDVDMGPSHVSNKEATRRAVKIQAKKAAVHARKVTECPPKVSVNQALKEGGEVEKAEAVGKGKKSRRFKPAPWICENMSFETAAPIRSDLDDALAFIASKPHQSYDSYEQDAEDLDTIAVNMLHRNRRRKTSALSSAVKYLSSLNYVTKHKLDDAIRVFGKKTLIKSDIMSRLKERDTTRSCAKDQMNANTAARLKRLGLQRREEHEPKKPAATPVAQTKPTSDPQKRRKVRWTQEQREERIRVPHEYELHAENVECDDPDETNLLCFLMDLQNRDMTPEDYEMLLRLDEKVAPKTTAAEKLASFRTETVSGIGADDDSHQWSELLCAVCMEAYENEQIVKYLPCEHFFHSQCIEMWLNNSGDRCPLDGLEV